MGEFDARYIAYFDRADIDGWEIRKGMGDLCAMDLVPEPPIIASALRACRRVNDFSLTTRILETVKIKCGAKESEIWPYIVQVLLLGAFSDHLFLGALIVFPLTLFLASVTYLHSTRSCVPPLMSWESSYLR